MFKILSLRNSKKLKRKTYRDAFVKAEVNNHIAHQIQINRLKRGLSQGQLAKLVGTKQSVISRYEDPAYGKYSIQTLLNIANALDIGLQVKFAPFSRVVGDFNIWTEERAYVPDFETELSKMHSDAQFNVTTISNGRSCSSYISADNAVSSSAELRSIAFS